MPRDYPGVRGGGVAVQICTSWWRLVVEVWVNLKEMKNVVAVHVFPTFPRSTHAFPFGRPANSHTMNTIVANLENGPWLAHSTIFLSNGPFFEPPVTRSNFKRYTAATALAFVARHLTETSKFGVIVFLTVHLRS